VEEDSETLSSLVVSVRQRQKTVTGLAGDVIKRRNERLTAQALARVATFYVPVQVTTTVLLAVSVATLLFTNKTAFIADCKNLYISSLALLAVLVAIEI